MNMSDRNMNLPYGMAQSLFWLSYCIVNSFAVVFLQGRGYNNTVIGILLATANLLSYALSGFMSDLIDRVEKITVFTMLPITLAGQVLGLGMLLFTPEKSPMVLFWFGLAMTSVLARNPLVIQLSVFLQYAGARVNYSICRAAGSLGYVLGSTVTGWMVSRWTAEVLKFAGLFFVLVQALTDIWIGRKIGEAGKKPVEVTGEASPTGEFIRNNPRFILMVCGATLVFFGHNVVNNYLINVVKYWGGDETTMGFFGSLGATYEIPVMVFFVPILRRLKLSVSGAMKISFAAFALKNILTAFVTSVPVYCFVLALQGFSYAVFIAGGVSYAKQIIPAKDAAKGQAFIANVTLIGAALSGLLGGRLYDRFGVHAVLVVSAFVVTAGALIGFLNVQRTEN